MEVGLFMNSKPEASGPIVASSLSEKAVPKPIRCLSAGYSPKVDQDARVGAGEGYQKESEKEPLRSLGPCAP